MRSIVNFETKINDYKVTIVADYYKGFKGSLEEPAEPEGWDLEDILLNDISEDDLDEVATKLGYFTWYEFWKEMEIILNDEYEGLLNYLKKNNY